MASAKANVVTREMLIQEIEEFNALIDRVTKSLTKYLPKSVIDDVTTTTKEQDEHDKGISFQTKVECISDFFINEEKKLDRKFKLVLEK